MINFTEGKINLGVKNILVGSDCEELNALAEQCLRVEWKTLETVLSTYSTEATSCRIPSEIAVGRVTRCHGSGVFCYVRDLIPYKKCLRTDVPVCSVVKRLRWHRKILSIRPYVGKSAELDLVYEARKMTMVICKKHGFKGSEKVSKILYDEFRNGHDISKKIRDFSFIIEEYECPFYGLQKEIKELPETCINGDFMVQIDERLNEVLERITVMCVSCLEEAMNGASLPVKDSVA